MTTRSVLIVGGGIGGLTAAIALRRKGFTVEIVEKDPDWTVYGVGIIQQFNVIRAMAQLGMLDAYLGRAHGFDATELYVGPQGVQAARFDTPRLAGDAYPSNVGIRRTDLQQVLAEGARAHGAAIRLGVTVERFEDDGAGVTAHFSDGTEGRFDVAVGADGVFSATRRAILPEAPAPRYTGQWVWRCNMPQPPQMEGIRVFSGPCNAGLVPLGGGVMYMFLLSQEAPGFRQEQEGAAAAMRARAAAAPPPLRPFVDLVQDDAGVVARPLEVAFLDGPWHRGRIALLGDAVHAATPHLAQGAGMAIEDALVLAEELAKTPDAPGAAFAAYRGRRFARAKFVAENSIRIGDAQMGKIPPVDVAELNGRAIALMAEPI